MLSVVYGFEPVRQTSDLSLVSRSFGHNENHRRAPCINVVFKQPAVETKDSNFGLLKGFFVWAYLNLRSQALRTCLIINHLNNIKQSSWSPLFSLDVRHIFNRSIWKIFARVRSAPPSSLAQAELLLYIIYHTWCRRPYKNTWRIEGHLCQVVNAYCTLQHILFGRVLYATTDQTPEIATST